MAAYVIETLWIHGQIDATEFRNTDWDLLISHQFHFIGRLGRTGKSALFRKLHAACCSKGLLIAICAATSLAALSFEGAVTAHSLFGHPVGMKMMSSEVQSKMIIMGHQISSCHVLVVRSFFIL